MARASKLGRWRNDLYAVRVKLETEFVITGVTRLSTVCSVY